MLVVPVVRRLLVVFVKLRLVLAVLIASLPAVLSQTNAGGQDENSHYSRTKQLMYIHSWMIPRTPFSTRGAVPEECEMVAVVGQDGILRAGWQPALYGPFCNLQQAG